MDLASSFRSLGISVYSANIKNGTNIIHNKLFCPCNKKLHSR